MSTLNAHNGHLRSLTIATLCPNLNALENLFFSIFMLITLQFHHTICRFHIPPKRTWNPLNYMFNLKAKTQVVHMYLYSSWYNISIHTTTQKNRVEHRWLHYIGSNAECTTVSIKNCIQQFLHLCINHFERNLITVKHIHWYLFKPIGFFALH